ncbi:hypothetical protein A7K91_03415 [Paenibacillus oryzae]|uniref:DZANK-type domain-containing protein n=1 Tax=Paenibacillus oryzae TaxID=1844972 RepID=A0A1A5YLL6_9BACL|nr:zinc ribbon domain-containing protein [Paenibacillus oryzae]OBR66507.1 hypothetical protein A7K91_03415 [Paenibacillus oryzae]
MAVKVCNQCGEDNSESATVCVGCSSSIKDVKPVGTLNSEKTEEVDLKSKSKSSRICSHCNERFNANETKCRYCGTPYSSKIMTSTTSSYYENNQGGGDGFGCATVLLFIATFFIPLVGLIVGGIFAFNDDPDKQSIGKGLLIFGLIMVVLSIIGYALIF